MKKRLILILFILVFIIHVVSVSALYSNFTIEVDDDVFYGLSNEDYVYGKITMNDTNSISYCISYVKTNDSKLIQTNPKYREKTQTTISLFSNEDTRQFFETRRGVGQVHWSKDNLIIDGRTYIFGVECDTSLGNQKSEKNVTVGYESVNSPITRLAWSSENVTAIMLLLIFFVMLSIGGWAIWRFGK